MTAICEMTRQEIEELEAAYRDDVDDYLTSRAGSGDPLTDQELWRYIKRTGGVRRSRDFWDAHLTTRENRAAFRYLDRGWAKGTPMDELAQEIGDMWPWFGITDTDSLWAWMQRTRKC